MDNAGYVAVTRQSGLMRKLEIVANNIANLSTTGFRKEGTVFAEHIKALEGEDPSLSMAVMNRHVTDFSQGALTFTNNELDMAIDGEGFFLVETPDGERLTRAGHFSLNNNGELVTAQGHRVLDDGGSAVGIPPGSGKISVLEDGTIAAGGQPVGRVGVVTAPAHELVREGDVLFKAEFGHSALENGKVIQGALEGSNVNPIEEIAELITVQRAYEMSQKIVQDEDERIKSTVRRLGQAV